jgi:hypothetical protein
MDDDPITIIDHETPLDSPSDHSLLTPIEIELIEENSKLRAEVSWLESKLKLYEEICNNIRRPVALIADALDVKPGRSRMTWIRGRILRKERAVRIKARYVKGESVRAIAEDEGISTTWIYAILNNKSSLNSKPKKEALNGSTGQQ